MAVGVEEDVLGLEVPVADAQRVEVLKREQHLRDTTLQRTGRGHGATQTPQTQGISTRVARCKPQTPQTLFRCTLACARPRTSERSLSNARVCENNPSGGIASEPGRPKAR